MRALSKTYTTSEVARIIGIHPNTVRLYEELRLIPKPRRGGNGYRIFTQLHLEQFRLARAALQVEVLQNGLRKRAVNIVKASAAGELDRAVLLTQSYLSRIESERENAREAVGIARRELFGRQLRSEIRHVGKKEAAGCLQISEDTLRNWERNGLLTARPKQGGRRVYTDEDIRRLKVIRSLRCANYSLASILRMLGELSRNPEADIGRVLDTPRESDEIITACDELLTSLERAEANARYILLQLDRLRELM